MKANPIFWILDPETPGADMCSMTARGPFSSLKSAEDWLRADAKETFLNGLGKHWAAPVHIVQVVDTVEQVPEVSVRVTLKRADIANAKAESQHSTQRFETALKVLQDPMLRARARRIWENEMKGCSVFWDESERQIEMVSNTHEIIILEHDPATKP